MRLAVWGHPPCQLSCIADPFTGLPLSVAGAAGDVLPSLEQNKPRLLVPIQSSSSWKIDDAKNFAASYPHNHHDEAVTTVQEFAMTMIVDRESQRICLEIPNQLNWKYHFGMSYAHPRAEENSTVMAHLQETVASVVQALPDVKYKEPTTSSVEELSSSVEKQRLRPVGLMLFSFLHQVHDPMRVWMYEYTVDPQLQQSICKDAKPPITSAASTGKWYHWNEVPYENMWADDILWMPQLLWQNEHVQRDGPDTNKKDSRVSDPPIKEQGEDEEFQESSSGCTREQLPQQEASSSYLYFEGHFVFDGPPGNGTPIHTSQYRFRPLTLATFTSSSSSKSS